MDVKVTRCASHSIEPEEAEFLSKLLECFNLGTDALAIGFLGFGQFLAGCAREKLSNCVSPKPAVK
jgi:hypothetical protein